MMDALTDTKALLVRSTGDDCNANGATGATAEPGTNGMKIRTKRDQKATNYKQKKVKTRVHSHLAQSVRLESERCVCFGASVSN